MVALYITSWEEGAGKTTIAAGLGKYLRDDGKTVGFFKPIVADSSRIPREKADGDATFMKHIFVLEEAVELLSPVFADERHLTSSLREAYDKVAKGKDVVIVEGVSGQKQVSRSMVGALEARVIMVEAYAKELLKAIDRYQDFGKYLLGVVLNKVPKTQIEQAPSEIATQFQRAGIAVLGILPEDRTLWALTVGELAEHIQGEIVPGAEKSVALVENIMLGAMGVDPGPAYFGRKANKAVILRSERPDMQLAALETSTRCLVLTGNTAPRPVVLYRAEEKNVPVILAKGDVTTITSRIESALDNARFNQESKLAKLGGMVAQSFSFPALYKGLGLTG